MADEPGLGDRRGSVVVKQVTAEELLGPDQAANHLRLRRVEVVAAGWVAPRRYLDVSVGWRATVQVPLDRTGDLDRLRETTPPRPRRREPVSDFRASDPRWTLMTHPTTDPTADSLEPPEAVDVALIGASAGREACLDLLLAEELSVDHDLALWFLAEAGEWRERPTLPDGDLVEVRSRINYWDDGMLLEDQGETDVHLTFRFSGGEELVVLVEDKVWAPFQLRQPERYAARARAVGGVAVLVAPSSYLDGRSQNAAVFHGAVAIEDLIDRIRRHPPAGGSVATRRAEWRARLLEELIRPRARTVGVDDPPTVAFTEFCTAWFQMRSPASIPDRGSCHTASQGWLWFQAPAGLAYKASGWARKPRAGVDLYLAEHGFTGTAEQLEQLGAEIGFPQGFYVTKDTAKVANVVLRYDCDQVTPSEQGAPEPGSDYERSVVEALEACAAATRWLQRHGERLFLPADTGG